MTTYPLSFSKQAGWLCTLLSISFHSQYHIEKRAGWPLAHTVYELRIRLLSAAFPASSSVGSISNELLEASHIGDLLSQMLDNIDVRFASLQVCNLHAKVARSPSLSLARAKVSGPETAGCAIPATDGHSVFF